VRKRSPRPAAPLGCVPLEDRSTPATFTVTTTVDNGNDANPTAGSLRQAIVQANATAGADTIDFNVPGGGVQTISPPNPLPAITDAVTIDGTTQPGYQAASNGPPVIRLSGGGVGAKSGLQLLNHSGSTIKALTIGGFNGIGIIVQGGGSHRIVGDFIGVSQNGTAADPNGVGVAVQDASAVQVGGANPGERNVISGNTSDGVQVRNSTGTLVINNFIGTDLNGLAAVANGTGTTGGVGVNVLTGSTNTLVGGSAAGAGNVIGGNAGSGVRVSDAATAGTSILGNRIGLGFSGQPVPNGGDGVRVENAAATAPVGGVNLPGTATLVRGNTIARNRGNGVNVRDTARYVRIDGNTIVNNDAAGIAVAATAQNGIAPPTLTGVTVTVGNATLAGSFTGAANTAYTVTVYGNGAQDANGAEAETQIGTVPVTTDASGKADFTFSVPDTATGAFLSATATDNATGDTSAISAGVSRTPTGPVRTFAAAGGSGTPTVGLFNGAGVATKTFPAFDNSVTSGVRVAQADFNGDGTPDVAVGTGPGVQARVRVLNGKDGSELFTLAPFDQFAGGVFVAAGDVNGDGTPDLVITPDQSGGPRVKVISGKGLSTASFTTMADFIGIGDPNFRGGARAAVGDVNGDKAGELIVSAGFGGGPRVAVYDGNSVATGSQTPTKLIGDFFAFEESLRNGAYVAAGDVDNDGKADLIFGAGPGGGPRVSVVSGAGIAQGQQTVLGTFFAGDQNSRGGVRVAAQPVSALSVDDIITGTGAGATPAITIYTSAAFRAAPNSPAVGVTTPLFNDSTDGVYVG
jgi:hypothetical protein